MLKQFIFAHEDQPDKEWLTRYRPIERRVDYLWPGKSLCQHINRFEPGEYVHDYGDLLQ